jgi:hypothetical protein
MVDHEGLTRGCDAQHAVVREYRRPELEYIGKLADLTQIGSGNGFEGSFGYNRNCKSMVCHTS